MQNYFSVNLGDGACLSTMDILNVTSLCCILATEGIRLSVSHWCDHLHVGWRRCKVHMVLFLFCKDILGVKHFGMIWVSASLVDMFPWEDSGLTVK